MVWQQQGEIRMHEVLRDLGRSIAGHTRVFDLNVTKKLLNQCCLGLSRSTSFKELPNIQSTNCFPMTCMQEMALVKILKSTPDHQKLAMGFLGGCMELKILWIGGEDLGHFLD